MKAKQPEGQAIAWADLCVAISKEAAPLHLQQRCNCTQTETTEPTKMELLNVRQLPLAGEVTWRDKMLNKLTDTSLHSTAGAMLCVNVKRYRADWAVLTV